MSGRWEVQVDSLYLNVEAYRWRNDSLQEHGFYGKWPKTGFVILYKITSIGFASHRYSADKFISNGEGSYDTLAGSWYLSLLE